MNMSFHNSIPIELFQTDESDLKAIYTTIQGLEVSRICDYGVILYRNGLISRSFEKYQIRQDMTLDGMTPFLTGLPPVYQCVYNSIYNMDSVRDNNHYELGICIALRYHFADKNVKGLFSIAALQCDVLLMSEKDYLLFSAFWVGNITKSFMIDNKKYYISLMNI